MSEIQWVDDEVDNLTRLVERVFSIEDTTRGNAKEDYIVRFRGHLLTEDTVSAYDQLAAALNPLDITPLFRWDDKRHAILLIRGMPGSPKRSNPWINLILFVLTLFSVLFVGATYGLQGDFPSDFIGIVKALFINGWPFALSILAILGTHEFGHYLAGRYHGLNITLPYFIPMPFSAFGTMGAFINMKGIPKNRRVLLDVGIAGPLSGLAVCIPILLIGLKLSHLNFLPTTLGTEITYSMEGSSILYVLLKWLIFGQLLPAPLGIHGLALIPYWISYFITGRPFPLGGTDVLLGPVAWAGWAGLLVTGLNLIPAGQLDGGHILYVLFGKKTAQKLYPFTIAILVVLGFVWNGWWLWAALIFFFGRTYAEPLDQITTLNPARKALAIIALIAFVFTFTPVPLMLY